MERADPSQRIFGWIPCLQEIYLEGVPFPASPTLLSSTSDLVNLQIHNIPPKDYISPEAMVAGLALLTRLETLSIRFQSQIFALNNGGGFASPSASCPSLSPFLSSKEMANIWRTSWPKSTLLDSSSLASSPTVPVHRSRRKARASPVQACASRTSWWQRLHQLCL